MELVGPGGDAVSAAAARPAGGTEYLPPLVRALCDDAAVFPPGLAPLREAIAAHRQYRSSWFAGMIGPLVLPASSLAEFQALGHPVPLCLTFPGGPKLLRGTLRQADGTSELQAVEIAVPAGLPAGGLVTQIEKAVDGRRVDVAVEVPRGARGDAVLVALAGSPYRAKFRTGGSVPTCTRAKASWPALCWPQSVRECRSRQPPGCTTSYVTPIRRPVLNSTVS